MRNINHLLEHLKKSVETGEPFFPQEHDIEMLERYTKEVVRCKVCKYKRLYDEGDTKYYYCALEDRPNRNWSVDDTDYCSWGEEGEVE